MEVTKGRFSMKTLRILLNWEVFIISYLCELTQGLQL